ncbi:MAG: TonB-dependent receptor [Nevskia sp.]|jgi:outer membrane receptor protein involved in Fe transport|nr:TonB-dependent receptor [Nevskia sp.]
MNLSADGKLRLAARAAFLAGVGLVASTAYAQETANQADTGGEKKDEATQLQGVQVTGSRIKQANITSSSAVTVIGEKELKLEGTKNIETLLNSIPQAFAGFGSTDSNGATGTATVNLRGLGSAETLVLIDGKRLNPGDPLQTPPSADLNFIPAALVEKVEVLSGGASAVYGSDAVAGVVNFILKKDFDGFQVDSEFTRTDHSDATTYTTSLLWGSNFNGGKGNVTLFAGYDKQEALTQDKRSFSAFSITTPAAGNRHINAGSRTIAEGRLYSYDRANAGLSYYGIIDPAGSRSIVDDDNRTYNFAPFNYLQRPDRRYHLGGFAHDKINDHVEVYGSALFLDDRSIAQVAPSGLFGDVASVPCNSSLLSAQERDYLCTQAGLAPTDAANLAVLRRTPELGARQSDLRHTDYRIVVGARGDIVKGISYDASAQRGEVIYQSGTLNYVNLTNARAALNTTTDASGNAVCRADAPAGCIPLDLFQLGGLTPDQANFIRANGYSQANLVEQVVNGSVSGDLGEYGITSPLAKNGLGLALGWEYRTEALDYRPDSLVSSGNLGGVGGPSPAVAGAFQVNEAFAELTVPLLEDKPFVKEFSVDGAYRWSNYSLANDAQSWKVGLRYAPVEDVTIRASYQRATRAPSVSELFSPQSFGLVGGSDPCAGANLFNPDTGQPFANIPTQAQCAQTGVTAAQYQAGVTGNGGIQDCNSGQCNVQTGGNTGLRSEDSKTYSIGLVFTPTFVKGLSFTADYFDIGISGAISTLPFSTIINQCLATGDAATCSLINRGPGGRLSGDTANGNFVQATLINTGRLRTKGVDFGADYRIRASTLGLGNVGAFSFNYSATYLDSLTSQPGAGLATYNCAGLFGTTCGTPNPQFRHKFRATWDITPIGLTVSALWRYYGAVSLDTNTDDPTLSNGRQNTIDGKIDAKQYVDLSGTYTLPTRDRNISLRFGISNVGGQQPPIVSSNNPNPISSPPFGNGNTFPAIYDSLGRVAFLGVTANF